MLIKGLKESTAVRKKRSLLTLQIKNDILK